MAEQAVSHICEGNMNFSNKLYEILSKKEGNVFYSPISAHAILSLVYQGADGESAESLRRGLHLSGTKIAADGYLSLMEKLNAVQDVKLHIANKIYVHHERTLKNSFSEISKKQFLAEAENIAFAPDNVGAAGKINTWVENKTNNKIKDLIQPADLNSDTRLVLVNAIYFKGDWLEKFDPERTRKEKFYLNETDTVDCDMMHLNKQFRYGEDADLDAQILSLPYKNENLSLMIILPKSKTGIVELEKKLATKNLTTLDNSLRKEDIILSLPKFKIETTMELNKPLTEMGMGVIFGRNAEFPHMLDSNEALYVSKVIQKAFIEVNEEGAEAAAATGVIASNRSLIREPKKKRIYFRANHSFFYHLCYHINGTIAVLFSGMLKEPHLH